MVMKFGGSSVASAERMLEVAQIVCSFPDQLPCVVLSAMGKVRPRALWWLAGWYRPVILARQRCTQVAVPGWRDLRSCPGTGAPDPPCLRCGPLQTTNLLLQAGEEALKASPANIASLAPLRCVPAPSLHLISLEQRCLPAWQVGQAYPLRKC